MTEFDEVLESGCTELTESEKRHGEFLKENDDELCRLQSECGTHKLEQLLPLLEECFPELSARRIRETLEQEKGWMETSWDVFDGDLVDVFYVLTEAISLNE